jgi:hypothetical protein
MNGCDVDFLDDGSRDSIDADSFCARSCDGVRALASERPSLNTRLARRRGRGGDLLVVRGRGQADEDIARMAVPAHPADDGLARIRRLARKRLILDG